MPMHPLHAVGESGAVRDWRSNPAKDKPPKRFICERMMLLQRPIGRHFPRVPSAIMFRLGLLHNARGGISFAQELLLSFRLPCF